MTSKQPRRPRRRADATAPQTTPDLRQDDDDVEIDLDAIYEESLDELDEDWLDRYGEASWYAAITLFGLFTVGDDTPLEDIPEEYRWRGTSRMHPTAQRPEKDAT